MSKTAVIIVTHNSSQVIGTCLDSLAEQTALPAQVLVVDSGSDDLQYLDDVENHPVVSRLIRMNNTGYARANNIGVSAVDHDIEYILFLNPDVLLQSRVLELAAGYMESDSSSAVITGRLAGYDFCRLAPTGMLDSTGIFRKWYGRWYDRGKGEQDSGQYSEEEYIPAVCGALMFCRKKALLQAALGEGIVFDSDFFLYKEDIELCLRLRKKGWLFRYQPSLQAYHGRGWQSSRKNMSRKMRRMAAQSEVLLYKKHPSPYMLWALGKYILVTIFDM